MSSSTLASKLVNFFKSADPEMVRDLEDSFDDGYANDGFRPDRRHANPDRGQVPLGKPAGMSGAGAEEMVREYSDTAAQGGLSALAEKLGRDLASIRMAISRHDDTLGAINDAVDEAVKARAGGADSTVAKRLAALERDAAEGRAIIQSSMKEIVGLVSGRSRHAGGPPTMKAHPEGYQSWSEVVSDAIDDSRISGAADCMSAVSLAAKLEMCRDGGADERTVWAQIGTASEPVRRVFGKG